MRIALEKKNTSNGLRIIFGSEARKPLTGVSSRFADIYQRAGPLMEMTARLSSPQIGISASGRGELRVTDTGPILLLRTPRSIVRGPPSPSPHFPPSLKRVGVRWKMGFTLKQNRSKKFETQMVK